MAERLWLAGLLLDIGGCLGAILGGHAHLARLGRAQGSERKARLEARAKVMARVMARVIARARAGARVGILTRVMSSTGHVRIQPA